MMPAPKSRGAASIWSKRKGLEPCRETTKRVRREPGRACEVPRAVETGPGLDWPFELEELAAAALMVECARIDGEFSEEERHAICRAVMEELVLDAETAERLVSVAEAREAEVWHDWLFTETIKTGADKYEQLELLGRLWEITLADGTVHPFEEQLVARIASELGIPEEALHERLTVALMRHPGLTSLTFDAAMRASQQIVGEHVSATPSEEKS